MQSIAKTCVCLPEKHLINDCGVLILVNIDETKRSAISSPDVIYQIPYKNLTGRPIKSHAKKRCNRPKARGNAHRMRFYRTRFIWDLTDNVGRAISYGGRAPAAPSPAPACRELLLDRLANTLSLCARHTLSLALLSVCDSVRDTLSSSWTLTGGSATATASPGVGTAAHNIHYCRFKIRL